MLVNSYINSYIAENDDVIHPTFLPTTNLFNAANTKQFFEKAFVSIVLPSDLYRIVTNIYFIQFLQSNSIIEYGKRRGRCWRNEDVSLE